MRHTVRVMGLAAGLTATGMAPLAGETVHVAPSGNDTAVGSVTAPFRTLRRLSERLLEQPTVTEVVLRGGVYRESLTVPLPEAGTSLPLLVRAAQGERVEIDGARPLDPGGFRPLADGVYSVAQSAVLGRGGVPAAGTAPRLWDRRARRRYLLAADGQAVGVFPGSYTFEADQLVIQTPDGQAPSGHALEISAHSGVGAHGIVVRRPLTTLRGLSVRSFFRNPVYGSGVRLLAAHCQVVDCVIENCPRGVSIEAPDATVLRCRASDVGCGVRASAARPRIVENVFEKRRDLFCVPMPAKQEDAGVLLYVLTTETAEIRANSVVGFRHGVFLKCGSGRFVVEENVIRDHGGPAIGGNSFSNSGTEIVCRRNRIESTYPIRLPEKGGARLVCEDNVVKPACAKDRAQLERSLGHLVARGCRGVALAPAAIDSKDKSVRSPAPFVQAVPLNFVGTPYCRTSPHGVVLSFETSVPCRARLLAWLIDCDEARPVRDSGGEHSIRVHALGWLQEQPRPGAKFGYSIELETDSGERMSREGEHVFTGTTLHHYVAPTGNDREDGGTLKRPWRTLQYAVDRSLPGDEVVLNPGIYSGETRLRRGGTATAPLRIGAAKPGTVVVDGGRQARSLLRLDAASHVVIEGLELRWFSCGGTYGGVQIAGSRNVTVRGCRIWNAFWWLRRPSGIGLVAEDSPGCIVERNLIFKTDFIARFVRSPGFRFVHNTAAGSGHGGVDIQASAEQSVLTNNDLAFQGNDVISIRVATLKELAAFTCDYNNLGTLLRDSGGNAPLRLDKGDWDELSKGIVRLVVTPAVARTLLDRAPPRLRDSIVTSRVWGGHFLRFVRLDSWREVSGQDRNSLFVDPLRRSMPRLDFSLEEGSPLAGAGQRGRTIGALQGGRKSFD